MVASPEGETVIAWLVLGLAVGSALGAWAAALWMKGRAGAWRAALEERLRGREEQIAAQAREAAGLRAEAERLHGELRAAEADRARQEAVVESERRAAAEKARLLDEARENLRKEFENAANRIFEDKGRQFTADSREHLERILAPLREQLGDFRKKIEDVHVRESEGRASLLKEIELLRRFNVQIGQDAENLTKALKGDSKTQGNWGEMILERVLEQSGLAVGREYDTQVRLKDTLGGGQSRLPDVVVHLPGARDVVIDSKVSLKDYEAFCSAQDEAGRQAALKAHIASVRAHIAGLSAKSYEQLQGIHALDVVLMCVPNESAFIAAFSADASLYEEAFARQIMPVSPSSLLLALRIVAGIWRREYQDRNVRRIAERGQLLYDKFVGFVEDVAAVGKGLDGARAAYDAARSKLSEGKGSLVRQADQLRELGIRGRKRLPNELIAEGDDEEPPADTPSS
jgi:DNA recombination protein RmuC